MSSPAATVLCVDLDGTLIRTDSLYENLIVLLRRNPLYAFSGIAWLLRGKAFFKQQVSIRAKVRAATLPYEEELLDFLREEHARGRKIALATASDRSVADDVASMLGIFANVFASNGSVNLGGRRKAEALVAAYGEKGFSYIGNEEKDAAVWAHADETMIVSASDNFVARQQKRFNVTRTFKTDAVTVTTLLRALRVHQWVKNLLLFVPLITAQLAMAKGNVTPLLVVDCALGFLAFSLCASSVYLLNDLFDLEADRAHPHKRLRPFASGTLSLSFGFWATPLLLLAALALGAILGTPFLMVLVGYLVLTSAYSWHFKQVALLDILMLASLYSLRIFAGGTVAGIVVSPWLLAFSLFIFFSLAAAKRLAELFELRKSMPQQKVKGRGYVPADLEQIAVFGTASGYLSALIIALYANDPQIAKMYHTPEILWLLSPLILYWISRVFLIAHRGELHEDPVVFALHDRASYVVAAIAALILLLAI